MLEVKETYIDCPEANVHTLMTRKEARDTFPWFRDILGYVGFVSVDIVIELWRIEIRDVGDREELCQ